MLGLGFSVCQSFGEGTFLVSFLCRWSECEESLATVRTSSVGCEGEQFGRGCGSEEVDAEEISGLFRNSFLLFSWSA